MFQYGWQFDDVRFCFRTCRKYDEMSDRVSAMPDTTEGLVQLQEYLRECQDVAQHQLKEEIDEAANRLKFFLDYAFFTSIHILPHKFLHLSVFC